MGVELWWGCDFRFVPKDPDLPASYSNLRSTGTGICVAHAVPEGSNLPVCGGPPLPCSYREPWGALLPEGFRLCPTCLELQPISAGEAT